MIQAVLFDLDGVIVDTTHYHYMAWQHMFANLGATVRKHTVLLHEGRSSREMLPILMKESGAQIPESHQARFIEEKRAYYRAIVRVVKYPEAFTVIDELRNRRFKVALVTGSARENMQHALDLREQARFDFIVTGDEVNRAKPFPDSFVFAARRLGIHPQECLAVENAPLGIEAAKKACMYCVAIQTTLPQEYLTSADRILQNIGELMHLDILKH